MRELNGSLFFVFFLFLKVFVFFLAGIFEEPFAAEKLKQDILKEIEILRNIEPPCDTNDWENLSKEQINAWDKWSENYYQAQEFNGANVVEDPLGEKANIW